MKELIPSSALPLADYLVAYAAFSAALLVLAVDPDLNILSAGALGIMIGLDRSRRCSLGVAACRDVRACAYCGGRLGDHAARPEHGHRGRQTRSLSEPFARSIFLCWAIAVPLLVWGLPQGDHFANPRGRRASADGCRLRRRLCSVHAPPGSLAALQQPLLEFECSRKQHFIL